jgi:hypothetical protein
MKSPMVIAALLLLIGLAVWGGSGTVYLVRELPRVSQLLEASDKAFVVVAETRQGWRGPRFSGWFVELRERLGIATEPVDVRPLTHVFTVDRSGVTHDVVTGIVGALYVFEGQLITALAGRVVTWTGTEFQAVPTHLQEAFTQRQQDKEWLASTGGWRNTVGFLTQQPQTSIKLQAGGTLRVSRDAVSNGVSLEIIDGRGEPLPLLVLAPSAKRVQRDEYERFFQSPVVDRRRIAAQAPRARTD